MFYCLERCFCCCCCVVRTMEDAGHQACEHVVRVQYVQKHRDRLDINMNTKSFIIGRYKPLGRALHAATNTPAPAALVRPIDFKPRPKWAVSTFWSGGDSSAPARLTWARHLRL